MGKLAILLCGLFLLINSSESSSLERQNDTEDPQGYFCLICKRFYDLKKICANKTSNFVVPESAYDDLKLFVKDTFEIKTMEELDASKRGYCWRHCCPDNTTTILSYAKEASNLNHGLTLEIDDPAPESKHKHKFSWGAFFSGIFTGLVIFIAIAVLVIVVSECFDRFCNGYQQMN